MLGRNSSPGWSLALAALSFMARCGTATAQTASPPPAVSVNLEGRRNLDAWPR